MEAVTEVSTVKGWLTPEEGDALHELALAASDPIVEIGSYCGKSTVCLASAAAVTGNTVVAIDHHRGNPEMRPGRDCYDPGVVDPFDDAHDSLLEFRRTIRRAGLEAHVVPIVAASEVVARFWSWPIGLLFIDGDHSYEGCRRDYANWSGYVAAGGMLVFHDVTIPDIGRVASESTDRFDAVGDVGCMRVMRRRA